MVYLTKPKLFRRDKKLIFSGLFKDNTAQQNRSTFCPQNVNIDSESFFNADHESGQKRGFPGQFLRYRGFPVNSAVFCSFHEIK